MIHYGLIGHPLSHSFSKQYFTEKFIREDIRDTVFENYDLQTIEELKPLLNSGKNIKGLCVTIPYKEKVISFLDNSSDAVKQIGACNSIKIVDGKLFGNNTDAIGFKKSLVSKLLPTHRKALILGTGGSSKAVAYVLIQLGIEYKFVTRSLEVTNSINYDQLTHEDIAQNNLIINCTPVGMYPNINDSPSLPYNAITKDHYLFDLTYNPAESLFLQKGKQRGSIIQNGYDMLIYQAEASWEIWNND